MLTYSSSTVNSFVFCFCGRNITSGNIKLVSYLTRRKRQRVDTKLNKNFMRFGERFLRILKQAVLRSLHFTMTAHLKKIP